MESKRSWEKRALCKDSATDAFFPEGQDAYKKFCKGCPVINLCRTYAIAHNEVGIWGGTSHNERARMEPVFIAAIRGLYYQAGRLEWRPGVVESYIIQQEELQRVRNVPIFDLFPELDPSLIPASAKLPAHKALSNI